MKFQLHQCKRSRPVKELNQKCVHLIFTPIDYAQYPETTLRDKFLLAFVTGLCSELRSLYYELTIRLLTQIKLFKIIWPVATTQLS